MAGGSDDDHRIRRHTDRVYFVGGLHLPPLSLFNSRPMTPPATFPRAVRPRRTKPEISMTDRKVKFGMILRPISNFVDTRISEPRRVHFHICASRASIDESDPDGDAR